MGSFLLLSILVMSCTQAFQQVTIPQRTITSKLAAVDPTTLSEVHQGLHQLHTVLQQDTQFSSMTLADAAAAVAEDAVKEDGWWKQYLNLFKSGLTFIHDGIDEPLQNMGITQTWGISIAIFTACEYRFAWLQ